MSSHPGDGWLVLVASQGAWELEPATVKTRRDTSLPIDDSSHWLVVSSSVKGTIALFRIPEIKARRVNARERNFHNPVDLGDGGTIPIRFGGSLYKVESVEEVEWDGGVERLSAKRDAAHGAAGGAHQWMFCYRPDMDRDGQLDLIRGCGGDFVVAFEWDQHTRQLVRPVARFRRYIDC